MTLLEKAAGAAALVLLIACAALAHGGQVAGLKADIALINSENSASAAMVSVSALQMQLADASYASSIEAHLLTQGRNIRNLTDVITSEARADPGLQTPVDPALKRALVADYQRLRQSPDASGRTGADPPDHAAIVAPALRVDRPIEH